LGKKFIFKDVIDDFVVAPVLIKRWFFLKSGP